MVWNFVFRSAVRAFSICHIWSPIGSNTAYDLNFLNGNPNRKQYKEKLNIEKLKEEWLSALSKVNAFFQNRDLQNVGALYYSKNEKKFISPIVRDSGLQNDIIIHHGSIGGSIPFRKS